MSGDKNILYPLTGLLSAVAILLSGLIFAKEPLCPVLLAGFFLWLLLFGCHRACLRVLLPLLLVGGVFAGITYAASGDGQSALSMMNRTAAVFLAVVPGMSMTPVQMTRCLSSLHAPRAVTLGMLIALSFVPLLTLEIRRVREAMVTRGAGSLLSPQILYRAFLIPLITRLVNISDTLSLSVETRGFTLDGKDYSIYHLQRFCPRDGLYLLGIAAGIAGMAVLA